MGSRRRRDVRMSNYFGFNSESSHDTKEGDEGPWPTDTVTEQTNNDSDLNQDYFSSETGSEYDDDYDEATMEGEQPSYDSQTKLPEFDAVGTYSLDLVGQKRVLSRERRGTVNHLELPEATESSLMAHIDHSQSQLSLSAAIKYVCFLT